METIEDRLTKAQSAVASITQERDDLRTSFEKLAGDVHAQTADANAKVVAMEKTVADLNQDISKLRAENAELIQKLSDATSNQMTIGKEAAKIAASAGVPPVAVVPGDDAKTVDANAIRQTFMNMKPGAEKSAFFKAHMSILTSTK